MHDTSTHIDGSFDRSAILIDIYIVGRYRGCRFLTLAPWALVLFKCAIREVDYL
jgi:hypothetical protein